VDCQSIAELLDAELAGELPDAESRAVRQHLLTCPECARKQAMVTLTIRLDRAVRADEVAPTLHDFRKPAESVRDKFRLVQTETVRSHADMDCRNVSERLSAELDGELPAAEAQAVLKHVQSCAECARKRSLLQQTQRAFRSVPYEEVDSTFDIGVRRKVRQRSMRQWQVAAAAAVLILVAGSVVLVVRPRPIVSVFDQSKLPVAAPASLTVSSSVFSKSDTPTPSELGNTFVQPQATIVGVSNHRFSPSVSDPALDQSKLPLVPPAVRNPLPSGSGNVSDQPKPPDITSGGGRAVRMSSDGSSPFGSDRSSVQAQLRAMVRRMADNAFDPLKLPAAASAGAIPTSLRPGWYDGRHVIVIVPCDGPCQTSSAGLVASGQSAAPGK
jgi:anti-sigma factor RsiW